MNNMISHLISVIVPVYNTEKYLDECIQSILNQSFTDFELLLIDDGSTDRSGAICDQYAAKDERVRVFHTENGGVSSARNVGLDEAKGEWIAFVDSDDWVKSLFLENFIRYVDDVDIIISYSEIETKNGIHKIEISSEGIVYGKSLSFMPCEPNYIILPSAGIMVQKNDINATKLDYDEVEMLCKNSTVGGFVDWRIPTIDELAILYINKDFIGGFKDDDPDDYYWSSSNIVNNTYLILRFIDGSQSTSSGYYEHPSINYARLVRTITE